MHHYKHRNLIERFCWRLKPFHRIATRYDKLASRFLAVIAIVAAFIWMA
jgi:transposase